MEHDFLGHLRHVYSAIDDQVLRGLARRHGELAHKVLDGADTMADLGQHFGAGLTAREVDYMIAFEWARTADDILWRRTKHGLKLNEEQRNVLAAYIEEQS
ncbi:glycerol-3-phosphate dehydrogenase C-terminal domain-containing protein [Pseudomonadota bacterium]